MTTPPPDVIVVQAPVTEVVEVQGGDTITIQGPERVEILELGIQGPEGEPGFEYEGEWDSDVAYDERDVVSYGGSAWIALDVTEAGDEPGVSELWALLASKGDPGDVSPLVIGTVETLDPGEDATAEITGTPPNQELNLGIPAGEPGDDGLGLTWKGVVVQFATYAVNDVVCFDPTYSGRYSTYICIQAGMSMEQPGAPGSETMWALMAARGMAVINGVGMPTSGAGVNGDFYLDTSALELWGPKADGTWDGTGPVSLRLPVHTVVEVTDGYEVTTGVSVVFVDATAGPVNVTLPAPSSGRIVMVKKTDAGANTVAVVGTVDGDAGGYLLEFQGEFVQLVSDSAGWRVVAE